MSSAIGCGVQMNVSLLLKNEEWAAGIMLQDAGRFAERDRVLLSGPVGADDELADRLTGIPADVNDTEAVLYPLAAQMVEAVRATGATLGDDLPIFGCGLRLRLAAVCAEIRGAKPVMVESLSDRSPGDQRSAVVVEAGAGFEQLACRSVRKGGVIVLATAPKAPTQDFHFYRNLQQTRVTLLGIPCGAPLFATSTGEVLRVVRALLSRGEAPPAVSQRSGRGSLAECLMSCNV